MLAIASLAAPGWTWQRSWTPSGSSEAYGGSRIVASAEVTARSWVREVDARYHVKPYTTGIGRNSTLVMM